SRNLGPIFRIGGEAPRQAPGVFSCEPRVSPDCPDLRFSNRSIWYKLRVPPGGPPPDVSLQGKGRWGVRQGLPPSAACLTRESRAGAYAAGWVCALGVPWAVHPDHGPQRMPTTSLGEFSLAMSVTCSIASSRFENRLRSGRPRRLYDQPSSRSTIR